MDEQAQTGLGIPLGVGMRGVRFGKALNIRVLGLDIF
jgi:hypothetical protein